MYEPFEPLFILHGLVCKAEAVPDHFELGSTEMDIKINVHGAIGVITITKEQAMKFFGLVDPNTGDDPRLVPLHKE